MSAGLRESRLDDGRHERMANMLPQRLAGVSPLLGRYDEQALVYELVEQMPRRRLDLRILGEPGVGKSSLLARAVAHGISLGYQVLAAEGVPSERGFAFAGIQRLLVTRPVELERMHELLMAHTAGCDGAERLTLPLATALLQLVRSLEQEDPLLIVTDDLEWMDPQSAELLDFFSRRVRNDPVGLISTVALHSRPVMDTQQVVELDPLSSRCAEQLLDQHTADLTVALRRRILQEARGNPLVLDQLANAVHRQGALQATAVRWFLPVTDRLESAFAPMLRTYPEPTRAVLLATSVNERAELAAVLSVAGDLIGSRVGIEAFAPATADGLVTLTPGHAILAHPVLASLIAAAEPEHRVRAAHRSLSEHLDGFSERQALHRACAATGYDEGLAAALDRWTPANSPKGTAIGSAAVLARAAELTKDPRSCGHRLVQATRAAYDQGDQQAFAELAQQARLRPLETPDRYQLEWMSRMLNGDDPVRADVVIKRCVRARRAHIIGDTTLALELLRVSALDCWWGQLPDVVRQLVARETERLRLPPTDARMVCILCLAAPPRRGRQMLDLIACARRHDDHTDDAQHLLGIAAHAAGDPITALELMSTADRSLREAGLLGRLAYLQSIQMFSHLAVGDLPAARTVSAAVPVLADGATRPLWADGMLASNAVLAALSGHHDEALSLAAETEMVARGARKQDLRARARLARGLAWLGAGEPGEAFRMLVPLLMIDDPAYQPRELYSAISYVAEAAWHSGNEASIRDRVFALDELAAQTGSPLLNVSLRYAQAVLSDGEEIERRLQETLEQDLTKWPLLRARTLLALGIRLRRQRRVAESRAPLRIARSLFEILGADPWLRTTMSELRAAGQREEGAPSPSARTLLSAQELQIAVLAGRGLSNREIGQRLHLSPRTIGSHLYRIFPKLDITSRAQLGQRLPAGD